MEVVKDVATVLTPFLVAAFAFILNRQLASLKANEVFEAGLKAEHYKAEVEYYRNKLTGFLNPLIACIEFDRSIWGRLSMLSHSEDVFSESLLT
ncbi:hypothetical protein [Microbulbifer litoralis]|uniref:hypothetical protein n=1 Tax=Microbulbifer litoralis TaxID=2933965 RepID=UPI002028DD64|nr:hypothetical protein [Microbulbifer sp. GX H0434]